MKKLRLKLTKGKIIMAVAALVVLVAAGYFFMPRSLAAVAHCPDNAVSISISEFKGGYNDTSKEFVSLTGEDAKAFIEEIKNTKVYISPFHTKLSAGGAVTLSKNITFEVKAKAGMEHPKNIYVFTDKILIIDGKQYTLYGSSFISYFLQVTNK